MRDLPGTNYPYPLETLLKYTVDNPHEHLSEILVFRKILSGHLMAGDENYLNFILGQLN